MQPERHRHQHIVQGSMVLVLLKALEVRLDHFSVVRRAEGDHVFQGTQLMRAQSHQDSASELQSAKELVRSSFVVLSVCPAVSAGRGSSLQLREEELGIEGGVVRDDGAISHELLQPQHDSLR